jgi:GNAT superfamily N-acetyltransferase
MSSFQYDPPPSQSDGFLQTVRLVDDGEPIATARWHAAPGDADGVVQILDFRVDPSRGRRGHGKRLLAAVIEQCLVYHKLRKRPLRRLWLTLHHKRHVIARAFFLSQGFTHTATIKDVAADGDLLVYVRTFD